MPKTAEYIQIAQWLEAYHLTDNARKKAKFKALIVSVMLPVVKHIAKTIARRADDPIDDLIQAGSIGLLKAIDNYSKNKNDNFRVYAGYLIIGEMKHFLRDKLSLIRVPRYIQELSIRINNFTRDLTLEEIQSLTTEDVAHALETSTKAVDIALEMDRRRTTVSLEDVFQSNSDSLGYEELLSKTNYKDSSELADTKILLENFIHKLPSELQIIVDMYYKQDMSQKEIAEELNLSQMSVSRRMKQAFNIIYPLIVDKQNNEAI
jgi:RNA polymerase sigma-B factor